MEKEPKLKNRLEELKEAMENASQGIEDEFSRSTNDWLSCFGSKVFVVETRLSSSKIRDMLGPDKYRDALERMERLKERLNQLKKQYPEKEDIPPNEIKEELLSQLDVLK